MSHTHEHSVRRLGRKIQDIIDALDRRIHRNGVHIESRNMLFRHRQPIDKAAAMPITLIIKGKSVKGFGLNIDDGKRIADHHRPKGG